VGTMDAIGISLAAGIWAGVVGWWFRASALHRRWIADARHCSPRASTPLELSDPCNRTAWPVCPVLIGATAATVAVASIMGRKASLWVIPFLVVWASGLAILAFIDLETLLLPSKLIYLCAFAAGSLLLVAGAATSTWHYLCNGLLCAITALVAFGLCTLSQPRNLGLGDARLASLVALGAGALSPVVCIVALACAPAVAAGFSTFRWKYRRTDLSQPIALGPFLALAGIAVVLAGAF
jgi:leader peptidase (prepilin peptidase) / N-methyltransferase